MIFIRNWAKECQVTMFFILGSPVRFFARTGPQKVRSGNFLNRPQFRTGPKTGPKNMTGLFFRTGLKSKVRRTELVRSVPSLYSTIFFFVFFKIFLT